MYFVLIGVLYYKFLCLDLCSNILSIYYRIFAVLWQKEMKRKVEEGEIKSLHRGRKEILVSKQKKGGFQALTWYLQG